MAAVAVAALLSVVLYISAGDESAVAGVLGVAGAVALAGGVGLRRGPLVAGAIALAGAAYGVTVVGDDLDGAAALVAGGLVLLAELAYWSIEPGAAVKVGRSATARRVATTGVISLASGVLASLLLAAGSTPLAGEAVFGLLGLVALVVIAGVTIWLLYSLRRPVE